MKPGITLLLIAIGIGSAIAADWPGAEWETAPPTSFGLDLNKLEEARDYALTAGGSGRVIFKGKAVFAWGDQSQTYDLKSTSKSIGVTLLGVALKDGKVELNDFAKTYHPTLGVPPKHNAQTGWLDKITLGMLANQTAGFDKGGGFEPLLFEPGTQWSYSDGGPNWLAECLTLVYRRDLKDVIFERVFDPIGITSTDIRWRNNAYRKEPLEGLARREFGSGFHANVKAMARLGYLYLREGWWNGEQILPPSFLEVVRHPDPALAKLPTRKPEDYGHASQHYSTLWWNNIDGTLAKVPRDAYWSWGLYDSLIIVIPSLDLVVARAGPAKSWKRENGAGHYKVLEPFLEPIVTAVASAKSPAFLDRSKVAPSPVIAGIEWAPVDSVVRKAKGSDNWPLTWADDGNLYTAYGDGNGFEPGTEKKLSLGLARVEGRPEDFQGMNLRSDSAEDLGDGKRGRKASGLLSVDGVLYLLVRNADNAHLGWSSDHGVTWSWADWKFTESFGCPAFLNYGRDNAGARDGFIYAYSQDAETAYERADRFVLARVPQDRIKERDAYEFFVKLDQADQPVWSKRIAERGAVLTRPGQCYRSSMSYDPGLKRYLWCQTGAGNDTRFAGGFSILDAPEPWGPWTVAFHTDKWDIGPGETQHVPPKWMSRDGRTIHLVFSGDDCFSVRRGELKLTTAP